MVRSGSRAELAPKVTAKRSRRAGVDHRIELHQSTPDSLGINEKVDFILLNIDVESIIYDYIIDNICKKALKYELENNKLNALRLYTKSGKYLSYLSFEKDLKDMDIKMINYYLVIVSEQIKRLNCNNE